MDLPASYQPVPSKGGIGGEDWDSESFFILQVQGVVGDFLQGAWN
jgi:hypothetical protein